LKKKTGEEKQKRHESLADYVLKDIEVSSDTIPKALRRQGATKKTGPARTELGYI